MGNRDKISERQLTVLIFISILSPVIRLLPRLTIMMAGRSAWLCAVPACILGILFVSFINYLKKDAPAGASLADMASASLGGVIGRIFLMITALWLTFYAGIVLRSASERLLSSVYPNGNPFILIVVTLAVSVIAAFGSTRGLVRTAEILLPIIAVVIIAVSVSALPDVDLDNLLPVTYLDSGKILLGSLPIFDVLGLYVYFLYLYGHVEPHKDGKKRRFPWVIAGSAVALAVTFITVGVVSDKLALRMQNVFFVIIRNIELFGVVERIEAVVVAIWIMTDFIFLAALMMIISEILHTVTVRITREKFIFPAAALAAAAAFFTVPTAFDLTVWSNFILPVVNFSMEIIVTPLVLIIGRIRRKI